MGRQKKGFNVRAREQHDGQLNRQEEVNQLQGKVVLDKKGQEQTSNGGGGEDTNQLVLPSAKRTLKKYKNPNEKVKILSKKRRKILQRVVDEKKKKAERGDLLERLKQVQIPAGQLEQMTSISSIQTKGVKRQMAEEAVRRELASQGVRVQEDKVKEVLGNPAKKMKIKKVLLPKPEAPKRDDVLGFEESSSEEEEDTEEESDAEITEEEKEEAPPSPVHVPKKVVPEVPKPVQTVSSEPKTFVPVHRTPEMQALREKLPIIAEEQAIMEAIQENPVVILAGETGSGKTTQVPQFLYEAGYTRGGKLIGVTEPRRVAAMAMANRVGEELNDKTLASFQIRFEGNVTEETKIKFMTDGILLREMAKDFRLRKYSAIIIDEAHERSVFTDILIGNLSRIVPMRAKDEENGPLKLIIMSATLRVEDFTENRKLFKELPPVIKVESRQFESTCHFQRETPEDYVLAALKKTCKIHRELPEGGILVFLTGQQEVNQMVRKLRKLFPAKQDQEKKGKLKNKDKKEEDDNETVEKAMQDAFKKSRKKKSKVEKMIEQNNVVVPTVNLDNFNTIPLDDTETDAAKDMEDEEDDLDLAGDEQIMEALSSKYGAAQAMWTLPLYSLMNSEKQSKIFAPVPEGHRLCVVATNIAETSLTIPGIKYVVDCGKVKTKFYDKLTGVSTFQVTWTSKAGANQRAGRAGRQGPGHCYRLYSSEVFKNSFPLHAEPEISKRPFDDLVLQMKAMKIVNVINFPFPTPPDPVQLRVAETGLTALGALKYDKESKKHIITELGKSMSNFPVAPCFSKMLALSAQHNLMPYTITIVAALTVQEVLLETPVGNHVDVINKEQVANIRRIWAGRDNSFKLGDPMLLMKAVGAAEHDAAANGGSLSDFCDKYALRRKAMLEIRKLRQQLTNEVNLAVPGLGLVLDPMLSPPKDSEALLLRQIVLAGMVNQVARKIDVESEIKDPKEWPKWRCAYRAGSLRDPVFIHGKSVFTNKKSAKDLPEWIVYQEIFETDKMYLRGVTAIEPEWLPRFAMGLCNFLAPLQDPEPWYDEKSGTVMCKIKGTFGPQAWPLPVLELQYPDTADGARLKYLGKFFLEGKIFGSLSKVFESLLIRPGTLVKSTPFQSGPVKALLKALAGKGIDSKKKLVEAFESNDKFLLPEIKAVLPKSLHSEVEEIWPPSLE